ncbi:hypothetical protein [Streptomyces africanus]|uniref:hypothetical protein n=1 Tax=Streptomyces africanus TaxID=231024 RepID=UPI000A3BBF6D|nr:hypothetical protein [Streptomyces africanus]
MPSDVEHFRRLCRTLAQHRRICTGESLLIPDERAWPESVRSEAEFDLLVSAAYKLWRETWKLDIGFLLAQRGADRPARNFDRLIYELRTASQHTDNDDAEARRDAWTSDACGGHPPTTGDDWVLCGQALMAAINVAVDCLGRLASAGRHSSEFRQAWQAKVSESVPSIVERVASDLGMYLSQNNQAYHVRQVERLWNRYRLRRGETPAIVIAGLAECSLVGQVDRLPCSYEAILDELCVLGTADAAPALRLAHAVAEIAGTKGDAYLKQVKSIWASLRLSDTP